MNFKGVKFINIFFYLKHYVASLKYFLRLGHEGKCAPKLSSKAEEIIYGLGDYLPPVKHLITQQGGTKRRPQMSGLLNNPAVQPLWSLSLDKGYFTSMATSGRPWTPALISSVLKLQKVHFHLSDAFSSLANTPIISRQKQLCITPLQHINS